MTFTAEPNIGSHLVEATPPNLLEHIDEHVKFLRECKITFTGSIGRGDIPYTKSAMTLLNQHRRADRPARKPTRKSSDSTAGT